jgi:hypothetical protein
MRIRCHGNVLQQDVAKQWITPRRFTNKIIPFLGVISNYKKKKTYL